MRTDTNPSQSTEVCRHGRSTTQWIIGDPDTFTANPKPLPYAIEFTELDITILKDLSF